MLKQFLTDIHIQDTYIQYGEVDTVDCVSGVSNYLENNKHKDLYFLANVDKQSPMRSKTTKGEIKYPTKNRGSDVDVIQKKYVYFDFDIYKEYEKKGKLLTPDEMKVMARDSAEKLSEIGYGDWSYLVYSGGGFHLYYIGEIQDISKQAHSKGYDMIAKEMSDHLGFPHDKSCKNVGRIARIPMSYNNKTGRAFSPVQVEILERREKKSDLLERILIKGQELSEKESARTIELEIDKERNDTGNYIVFDAINQIPITDELFKLLPWTMDGEYNFMTETGNLSASYLSRVHPNCIHRDESREFTSLSVKTVSTFTMVRHLKRFNNAETFRYFEDAYPNIKALGDEERRKYMKEKEIKTSGKVEKKKTQIGFISWNDMLEEGEKEQQEINPKDIFSYGYNFLDEKLGGLFPNELLLIGGITNTGKTTLALKIGEGLARQGKKVVVVALEERLKTRARKAICYEINRRRKSKKMEKIRMIDFLTGRDKGNEIERREAINSIQNDGMEYVTCETQLTVEDLERVYAKNADFYILDHLHYFGGMNAADKSKADTIEETMHKIKALTKQYDARTILIAHFTKLDESKKPTMTNFKDSISIAQTADTVMMLWRDKSIYTEEIDQYHTHFIIPKNRVDEPSVTIEADFDINTNDYKESTANEHIGTENSYDMQRNAQNTFI